MKNAYFVIFKLTLLTLIAFGQICHAQNNSLLVVGDSLSAASKMPIEQGWVALLSEKIKKEHPEIQVINLSRSGDTSHDGLQQLKKMLPNYNPRWVIIELGGNDGLRGLSLNALEKNLAEMIQLSQQHKAKVMLLGITLPPNYGAFYIKKFDSIYKRLAIKYDLPWTPFVLSGIADKPSLMLSDGIHPTSQAQPLILKNVWSLIEKSNFITD